MGEPLKATELIEQLQKLIEEHGDCRVVTPYDVIREIVISPAVPQRGYEKQFVVHG